MDIAWSVGLRLFSKEQVLGVGRRWGTEAALENKSAKVVSYSWEKAGRHMKDLESHKESFKTRFDKEMF